MQVLQRIASPPDPAHRSVELALALADAGYVWSIRIDDWASVVSSGWRSLDTLESLVAALDALDGDAAITEDVTIAPSGDAFDIEVVLTAPDGSRARARDDIRGLGHTARTLLERAGHHAERNG